MPKEFLIPDQYRSPLVGALKKQRHSLDAKKRDSTPTLLDLGQVQFKLARHFGFCYGVENAIETAYRALEENKDKRVFLLSEMIHNEQVNSDLRRRGIEFLQTTHGEQLIPFETLTPNDVVIVPAFGTTVELFAKLEAVGIDPQLYNATCPFVEKVWKRADQIGIEGFTIVIHGKEVHEETRATFSHAKRNAASLVIRDIAEAKLLASFIDGTRDLAEFEGIFGARTSTGFDAAKHLARIGVVNQTTMLATDTLAISELLREAMLRRVGPAEIAKHFADTRDTLCYATWDNQTAVRALLDSGGDLAVVVGGYNSSNTSHLVELCEERVPTFYIRDESELLSASEIQHFDWRAPKLKRTTDWLPSKRPLAVLVTAGASCPDAIVDRVLARIAELVGVRDAWLGMVQARNDASVTGTV